MFCTRCGSALKEGARFCSACGAPAVEVDELSPDTQEQVSDVDVVEAAKPAPLGQVKPVVQSGSDGKQPKKKLSTPLIVAIVVALIVCIALVIVLIVQVAAPGGHPSSQGGASEASGQGLAPEEQAEAFDPEKERAAAREAAIAAGKQVFSGTIMATTDEDAWVMSIGRNPNAGAYYTNRPVTILLLDEKTSIEGANLTSSGGYKTLQNQDVIELPDSFAADYNGQHVDMAFSREDLHMPSDVSHIKGDGEVVYADGTAASNGASPTVSSASQDYVLADSATKRYSRQELEKLDDHTLFLARNEIYARHGRLFKNAELQQYFASKPWYKGTIDPDAFSDSMLSDTELANASLMLDIEKARGSSYI